MPLSNAHLHPRTAPAPDFMKDMYTNCMYPRKSSTPATSTYWQLLVRRSCSACLVLRAAASRNASPCPPLCSSEAGRSACSRARANPTSSSRLAFLRACYPHWKLAQRGGERAKLCLAAQSLVETRSRPGCCPCRCLPVSEVSQSPAAVLQWVLAKHIGTRGSTEP